MFHHPSIIGSRAEVKSKTWFWELAHTHAAESSVLPRTTRGTRRRQSCRSSFRGGGGWRGEIGDLPSDDEEALECIKAKNHEASVEPHHRNLGRQGGDQSVPFTIVVVGIRYIYAQRVV